MRRRQGELAICAPRRRTRKSISTRDSTRAINRNLGLADPTTRDSFASQRGDTPRFLFGNTQVSLSVGDIDAGQGDKGRAPAHFVAKLRVAADHQRYHARGHERGAVGTIDHLAGCAQLFADRARTDWLHLDTHLRQGRGVEPQLPRRFLASLRLTFGFLCSCRLCHGLGRTL